MRAAAHIFYSGIQGTSSTVYLETEGENTFFLAVVPGPMVDPGGIVSGLKELGYTVELVP